MFKTTKKHQEYWSNRKIDWKTSYFDTYNHPHRNLIIEALSTIKWLSLIEIGVGGGANILRIIKSFPGRQVGGIDLNKDAIDLCNKTFQGGLFKVNSADDIMMSDDSTDIVLSDATLIYVDPFKINKYLQEIKRITRNHILLCEFHHKSWIKRLKLWVKTGYFAYNWPKILEKNGFYDIQIYKMKEEDWPGGHPWNEYGNIILAKVSKVA